MKKILLLGSGELGKEFVIAARWPTSAKCFQCSTAMLSRLW